MTFSLFSYRHLSWSFLRSGATLVTIFGFILLLSLGTWQIHRLHWKQNLITKLNTRLHLPFQNLETLYSYELNIQSFKNLQDIEFYPVYLSGQFVSTFYLKLQGRLYQHQVGYHLIKLLKINKNANILIDCGWMPLSSLVTFPLNTAQKEEIRGYIRLKSDYSFMIPPNAYLKQDIYTLDPYIIAQDLNLKNCLPFYIVQTQDQSNIHQKYPPFLAHHQISIRNSHLSYAIIWYSLAFILITVYILYINHLRKNIKKR